MEKDGLFGSFNWQPDHHNISVSAAVAAVAEINNNNNNISNNSGSCDNGNGNGNGNGADQSSVLAATSSFLNLNWDQSSADQTANFESALSSLVSSPTTSNPNPNPNPSAASADSLVIRELIGRLGSICNNKSPSDASPPNSSHYQSTNNSCYSTPLNSPPKLSLLSMMDRHPQFHLARAAAAGGGNMGNNNNNNNSHRPIPFAADPGFAERAARFSCFGAATATATATARNYTQFGLQEPGKLSRVSSSQSLKGMTASINGVGMNVNHSNPMHLQQPQQPDGMGSGIGGQLENEMVMMMMMRSGREFGSSNTQEESSASGRMAPNVNMNVNEGNVRKRKATTPSSNKGGSSSSGGGAGRGKEATPAATPNPNPPKRGEEENSNSKRSKSAAATGEAEANADGTHAVKTPKAEQNSTSSESAQKQGKDKNKNKDMDNNVNPPEPPKQDYIHVRARRGQATDSHSLAERVRREKISERMKFLQDLVPGCNKVTGKAVMLDEIINYVQSLQRQVEFLSMKLATVNPRLDINVDNLLTKDVHQPRGPMMAPQSSYPLEATSNVFSYANLPEGQNPLQSLIASNGLETQCSVNNPLDASSLLRRSLGMQLPSLEGFADAAAASQLGAFWEDDLQSVVQMGFGQNQEAMFSHNFQGPLPTSHMKIEL